MEASERSDNQGLQVNNGGYGIDGARERVRATAVLELALHLMIFLLADLPLGMPLFQDRKRRFGLTHLGGAAPRVRYPAY